MVLKFFFKILLFGFTGYFLTGYPENKNYPGNYPGSPVKPGHGTHHNSMISADIMTYYLMME